MPITNADLNRLLGDGPSNNGNRLTSRDVQRLTGADAVPSMSERRQFNAQRHQINRQNDQQVQQQREYNDRINQNVQQLIDLDDPDEDDEEEEEEEEEEESNSNIQSNSKKII